MGIAGNSYGIEIGSLKKGRLDSISDVRGVTVGHCTLSEGEVQTGVTAVLPHGGDLFREKVPAACYVINGFGKSVGLVQVEELGNIETPILLTNTLSVGACADALVKYMLDRGADIGLSTGTVNPVVCECNDGWLNDIRGMRIGAQQVRRAISDASENFAEGSVGAGRGMRCFGLKGGIGSASRLIELGGEEYVVGALVLSNFGSPERLTIGGDAIGRRIYRDKDSGDSGSIIVILATDAPMDSRQLRRLCKRAGVGLVRTGSFLGNGSGDVVLAFSTANRIEHYGSAEICEVRALHENSMDKPFLAAAEAVEEAVISSLLHAETTVGRDGHTARSLSEYLEGAAAQD